MLDFLDIILAGLGDDGSRKRKVVSTTCELVVYVYAKLFSFNGLLCYFVA